MVETDKTKGSVSKLIVSMPNGDAGGTSSDDDAVIIGNSNDGDTPQHTGYTLLGDGPGFGDDDEEDGDSVSNREDHNPASFDVDAALWEALNSDGETGENGAGLALNEEEDIPDESSPALLWNVPRNDDDKRIIIPEDKVAEIKACFSGFKLPEANLPTWAKDVPEEVWKKRLLEHIAPSSRKH